MTDVPRQIKVNVRTTTGWNGVCISKNRTRKVLLLIAKLNSGNAALMLVVLSLIELTLLKRVDDDFTELVSNLKCGRASKF